MAVISGADYRNISLEYDSIRARMLLTKEDAYDAVYLIVRLNEVDPEVDLLAPFNNAYLAQVSDSTSTSTLINAVRALNQHAIVRGGYADIDAYLAAESITVPQNWADLSEAAGFTIADVYIDP